MKKAGQSQLETIEALHRFMSVLQRTHDEVLQSSCAISFSQWRLLMEVDNHTGCSQQALAMYLGQTEAAVSRQARGLRSLGLLKVEKSKKDARQRIVTLTPEGRVRVRKAAKLLSAQHNLVLSGLSADEQKFLQRLLQKATFGL